MPRVSPNDQTGGLGTPRPRLSHGCQLPSGGAWTSNGCGSKINHQGTTGFSPWVPIFDPQPNDQTSTFDTRILALSLTQHPKRPVSGLFGDLEMPPPKLADYIGPRNVVGYLYVKTQCALLTAPAFGRSGRPASHMRGGTPAKPATRSTGSQT